MKASVSRQQQWEADIEVLARIGVALYSMHTDVPVELPADLITRAASHQAGITFTHYPNHGRHASFRHTIIR